MANQTAVVGDTVQYRTTKGGTRNVLVTGAQKAAPVAGDFTVTASDTGGSLAAATYSYKVTAVVDGVETPVSVAETSIVTTGSVGSVTIDFTAGLVSFPTATAWKVYGRSAGTELLIATITAPTATYLDTGAVTPAGAQIAATAAIRANDIAANRVIAQIPKATSMKSTNAYFKR